MLIKLITLENYVVCDLKISVLAQKDVFNRSDLSRLIAIGCATGYFCSRLCGLAFGKFHKEV